MKKGKSYMPEPDDDFLPMNQLFLFEGVGYSFRYHNEIRIFLTFLTASVVIIFKSEVFVMLCHAHSYPH